MQKGLIGKKIGMTQLFDEQGNVVPVTVIEAGPCPVVPEESLQVLACKAFPVRLHQVDTKLVIKQ